MRYFFRGKRGGLIVFLAIAALVTGGLGWVTAEALRLERDALRFEREQLEARAEADLTNKLRIALWGLDSWIVTVFTNEANRPYHQYSASAASPLSGKEAGQSVTALELTLLPGAEPTAWMQRHFLVASQSDWQSPQALRQTLIQSLSIGNEQSPSAQTTAAPRPLLAELSTDQTLRKLLKQVREQDTQLSLAARQNEAQQTVLPNPAPEGAAQQPAPPNDSQPQGQAAPYAQSQFPGRGIGNSNAMTPQQKLERDKEQRYAVRAQAGKAAQDYANNAGIDSAKEKSDKKTEKPVLAVLGPMIPLWLAGGPDERLVVARLIQIGPKLACHVTLVDWPRLQALLAERVGDDFPEARFLPIHEGASAHHERAMTALPVELDPGPSEIIAPPRGWTPLHLGLALAWVAALAALLTVGLGGWSLLDLSERRIRFVSAVTHELRTPLTTLRLYLDMLTGGLVKEERQKAEYLQTLHAEADRLHRLIGNVLDFSRLENQRPRLEKTTVALGVLLEQVYSTWDDRCQQAEKELLLDNPMGSDLSVFTDVQIVHQILGNLIDNACKYSRGAEDRRIWLRARGEERHLVLEVEDRGPGVPPVEGRSIFRPFRRGRDADVTAGGVGLGLALAQRWAQLLGGRLTLHGQAGQGACFRLELPR